MINSLAKRIAVGTAGALVASLALATPAMALNQTRTWDKRQVHVSGVLQGEAGAGTWKLAYVGGTLKSTAKGSVRDARPGGASIYFQLRTQTNSGTCFEPPWLGCQQAWYNYRTDDSAHSNSDRWVATEAQTGIRDDADGARGSIRACEEVNFAPDKCGGFFFTKPDDYT